jgi:hypothetical protein
MIWNCDERLIGLKFQSKTNQVNGESYVSWECSIFRQNTMDRATQSSIRNRKTYVSMDLIRVVASTNPIALLPALYVVSYGHDLARHVRAGNKVIQ